MWPAQVLGTYCLGGTLTSRLDRVLREEKGYTYGVRAFGQVLRSAPDGTGAAMLAISGSVDTPNTGPALQDLWTVLRTLAAEGLTDAERDVAVQNLVGVAPLKYETAAAVASTLADQVEQHLPDDYQADAVPAARRDRHRGGHRGGRERLPGGPSGDGPRRRRGRRSRGPSRPSASAKSPSWPPSSGGHARARRARRGPGVFGGTGAPLCPNWGRGCPSALWDALQKPGSVWGLKVVPLSFVRAVRQAVRRTRGTGQSSPSPRTARARGAGDPPQSLG